MSTHASRIGQFLSRCGIALAALIVLYCGVVGVLISNSFESRPLPEGTERVQIGMSASEVVHALGKPDHARKHKGVTGQGPSRSTWIFDRGIQVDFEDGRVSYVGEVAGY